MSKVFIDTNVLVYMLDQHDLFKQDKARDVLRKINANHQPVISTQVIKEFYVVATSKLKADPVLVKNIVHNFSNMEVVNNDLDLIEIAIDISILSRLSFWDSLIIAAAEKAKCSLIVSEGFNSGQTYRGVKVINFLKDDIPE